MAIIRAVADTVTAAVAEEDRNPQIGIPKLESKKHPHDGMGAFYMHLFLYLF